MIETRAQKRQKEEPENVTNTNTNDVLCENLLDNNHIMTDNRLYDISLDSIKNTNPQFESINQLMADKDNGNKSKCNGALKKLELKYHSFCVIS